MSSFLVYIRIEPYLRQWFVHDHDGKTPVELRRGSVESKVLEVYLSPQPKDSVPDSGGEDTLAIRIPTFRHKPPETYNHLPKYAQAALINCIRNRFDVELWNDLHHFGRIWRRKDELIYAWMENHGIEMTEANWNAIAKRYQRQRDLYLTKERMKKSAKKSQKSS